MNRDGGRSAGDSLENAYEAAWDEWSVEGEQQVWDMTAGDGLEVDGSD